MSMCGSLQHIFENPSLPDQNPTLIESLSLNQIKLPPPVKSTHSFTEIFGELHFKENNAQHVSNTTTTPTTKNTSEYGFHSSLSSESLHLCTEGLGFESSDEVEDSKNNNTTTTTDEREKKEGGDDEKKELLGLENWCGDDEYWRTRLSPIRVNNNNKNKKNGVVEYPIYPPPISSIGRSGKPWVSFMSYRDNGRFVLKEIRTPVQEFLHAHREDGRLKLHFLQPDQEDEDDDDEEHVGKENYESSVTDRGD